MIFARCRGNRLANGDKKIAAVILAAGRSSRFGEPKSLAPWEGTTVLGHIIRTIRSSDILEIVVVTGRHRKELKLLIKELGVKEAFNSEYANGSMVRSLQTGLKALSPGIQAALVMLGDQPQVTKQMIGLLNNNFNPVMSELIVPVFDQHKGHPWILGRKFWQEIYSLSPQNTLRDFLKNHEDTLQKIFFDSDEILEDFDTKDEYLKLIHRSRKK